MSVMAAGDLPDVNLWLALSADHHIHHLQAQSYWKTHARSRIWFCRHTALGLKRLLGQSSVMGAQVQAAAQCWTSWQTLMRLKGVGMVPEPATVDAQLAALTGKACWPGKMWSDAYLAAFAIAGNLRLVSFDRDFSRFPGLDWLHLTAEVSA